MFNLYPYTNMHNLNLDWIIGRIKELGNRVDSFSAELREYVREYLSEFLQDGTLDVAAMLGGYVNINAFNPVADGVTDDSAAFAEAVRFCNTYNVNLCCNPGARYYVASPVAENMLHSIDGRGCTFVMGAAPNDDVALFTLGAAGMNRYYNAADYSGGMFVPSELRNASFFLVSGDDLGERGTSGYHEYASRMIVTDPTGTMINGCLPFNMGVGWEAQNIRKRGEIEIRVENINAEYGAYNSAYTFGLAKFVGNNGRAENIHVFGQLTNPDIYTGAVVTFEHVTGCSAKNVDGENPTATPGSGYLLGFSGCDNVHIEDCATNHGSVTSWGAMGANFLSNVVVERCYMNRVDCHYMAFDSFVIRDCVLEKVALPEGGTGTITIEDCTINAVAFAPITRRDELSIVYDGVISILRCTVESTRENHSLIEYEFADKAVTWGNTSNAALRIRVEQVRVRKSSYLVYFNAHGRLNFTPTLEMIDCDINRATNHPDVRSDQSEPINIMVRGLRRTGSISYLFGDNPAAKYVFDSCNFSNVRNQTVNVGEAIFANNRINGIYGTFAKLAVHGCIFEAGAPTYTATLVASAANIPLAWNV